MTDGQPKWPKPFLKYTPRMYLGNGFDCPAGPTCTVVNQSTCSVESTKCHANVWVDGCTVQFAQGIGKSETMGIHRRRQNCSHASTTAASSSSVNFISFDISR